MSFGNVWDQLSAFSLSPSRRPGKITRLPLAIRDVVNKSCTRLHLDGRDPAPGHQQHGQQLHQAFEDVRQVL